MNSRIGLLTLATAILTAGGWLFAAANPLQAQTPVRTADLQVGTAAVQVEPVAWGYGWGYARPWRTYYGGAYGAWSPYYYGTYYSPSYYGGYYPSYGAYYGSYYSPYSTYYYGSPGVRVGVSGAARRVLPLVSAARLER